MAQAGLPTYSSSGWAGIPLTRVSRHHLTRVGRDITDPAGLGSSYLGWAGILIPGARLTPSRVGRISVTRVGRDHQARPVSSAPDRSRATRPNRQARSIANHQEAIVRSFPAGSYARDDRGQAGIHVSWPDRSYEEEADIHAPGPDRCHERMAGIHESTPPTSTRPDRHSG